MTRTSNIVATLAVAAMALTAGCSATKESEATDAPTAPTTDKPTDSTTPDTEAVTTTADPGPPADIVFGFGASTGDPNAIRDKYGVQGQNQTLDGEALQIKLIDDINASGGFNGHKIVPLLFQTPTGEVAPDVLDQQRCEFYFGGSVKANVVLGDKTPILNACAAENGAVVLGQGLTGTDSAALADLSTYINPQAPNSDTVAKALVDLAVARGVITAGSTVGVLAQSCPDFQRVVDDSLTPALEAAGATVSAFSFTCVNNNADQGKAIAEIPAAVLQLKAAGASAVVNLDRGFIGTALIMNEANAQGLTPTWLLSTSHELGGLPSMSPPAAELEKVLAVGWSPLLDVGETDVTKLGDGAKACVDRVTKLGFAPPANLGEVAVTLGTCTSYNVIEAMVAESPGALDSAAMLASLAKSTEQLSLLVGSTDWAIGRQPVDSYRPVVYDAATQRFAYDGEPTTLPA